ncbi:FAS1 domain-containing protein [Fennellomyces sp. T-0311]|nr:FAS1 domain-containing protein [Fennellomyces sp. T-0311]
MVAFCILLLLLVAPSSVLCSISTSKYESEQQPITPQTIIDAIKSDPRTSILGELIDNDPLLESFRRYIINIPNISVLAPCNEALASNDHIQQFLSTSLYYLSVEQHDATDDAQLQIKATLLNGTKIKLRIKDSYSKVPSISEPSGYANVIGEPIIVRDGTIYVVEQVPSVPKDVSKTLQEMDTLSMAYELFNTTYRSESNQVGEMTIFAPADEAFGTVNPVQLSETVRMQMARWHTVPGVYYSNRWENSTFHMKTMDSEDLEVRNGKLWLEPRPARILKSDVLLSNGVLHVIDEVVWTRQAGVVATSTAAQTREGPIPSIVLLIACGLTFFGRSVL